MLTQGHVDVILSSLMVAVLQFSVNTGARRRHSQLSDGSSYSSVLTQGHVDVILSSLMAAVLQFSVNTGALRRHSQLSNGSSVTVQC